MKAELLQTIIFTAKILATSCLINLLAGTATGVILSRKDSPLCRILDILVALPMVFPPIAMGFFLVIVFGRGGLIGNFLSSVFDFSIIFSPVGVFIASFVAGFPLMVKSVRSAASQLDISILESARIQGADTLQILTYIIVPNIKVGILSGLTLSAARSLGEVGMTLLLGGNISGRTETISLAIFNAVFEGYFTKAALLSLLLGFVSLLLFFAIQQMERDENFFTILDRRI